MHSATLRREQKTTTQVTISHDQRLPTRSSREGQKHRDKSLQTTVSKKMRVGVQVMGSLFVTSDQQVLPPSWTTTPSIRFGWTLPRVICVSRLRARLTSLFRVKGQVTFGRTNRQPPTPRPKVEPTLGHRPSLRHYRKVYPLRLLRARCGLHIFVSWGSGFATTNPGLTTRRFRRNRGIVWGRDPRKILDADLP